MRTAFVGKTFMLSGSQAPATQLADTRVTVTAPCPGSCDTGFFRKAGPENTRGFRQANRMAPQDVASEGYRAVINGERPVVPGLVNALTVFSRRFMSDAMQAKVHRKRHEEIPPGERQRTRGEREDRHARP